MCFFTLFSKCSNNTCSLFVFLFTLWLCILSSNFLFGNLPDYCPFQKRRRLGIFWIILDRYKIDGRSFCYWKEAYPAYLWAWPTVGIPRYSFIHVGSTIYQKNVIFLSLIPLVECYWSVTVWDIDIGKNEDY